MNGLVCGKCGGDIEEGFYHDIEDVTYHEVCCPERGCNDQPVCEPDTDPLGVTLRGQQFWGVWVDEAEGWKEKAVAEHTGDA